MKLVIQTQFRENYGAHDWDGKGECPQYWKCKGGSTYIVEVNLQEAQDVAFYESVQKCIEHKSDYSEEFILGLGDLIDEIDFKESDHVEHWESPIYCIKLSDRDELLCKSVARKYDMEATPYGERSWSQTEDGCSDQRLITFEQMDEIVSYYKFDEAS